MLSGLIWGLVTFAPNGGAAGDAWGSLLSAQALVEHGSFDLSSYADRAAFNDAQFFRRGSAVYYWYPPGAPLLEVPLVAVARQFGLDMTNVAHESLMERQVNAICMVAMLGALQVGLAALWGERRGLLAAFLVLMASTYSGSIASSMANSQMPEILFLTWTQAWLLRFDRQGGRLNGWMLGLFLGLAYLCRPTAILWSPLAFVYLAFKKRDALPGALGGLCVCYFGLKLALVPLWAGYHPYYAPRVLVSDLPTLSLHWIGVLFSPGLGLFVYQPLLLPAFLLTPVLLRRSLLAWMLFLYIQGHALVVALQITWMTAAFGPRLMAEACFPLWFLAAMLLPSAKRLQILLVPALLWSLWLNTYLAFFTQTQHLHWTATRPEQDPTTHALWEWKLAPYWVTQDQLWQMIREAPAELFPALSNPICRGFLGPEQAGDQALMRLEGDAASLLFRSGREPGPSDGLVNLRYRSAGPVRVTLNGKPLGVLPPSQATRRHTFDFHQLEWRPENELQFFGGRPFRLFDVVADTSPADQPGVFGRIEGWSGDEGGAFWAFGPFARALLTCRREARVDLDWQALNPHRDLDLEVWCNGSRQACLPRLAEGESQMHLSLPLRAGDNLVEFRFSRWGISGARDQRPLALRFANLRLRYSGL